MTDASPAGRCTRRRALHGARAQSRRRGLGHTWPNPAVGAVIVKDGVIVGRGWTQEHGRPHAEVEAIKRAKKAAQGATMYVYARAVLAPGQDAALRRRHRQAGITRVVSALEDPNRK